MAAAVVGLVLVAWMLARLAAIGVLLPGVQFGFLAGGVALTALGAAGGRNARHDGARSRMGRSGRPASGSG